MLRLLEDNLESFIRGIPIADLPNTVRDAVSIAQWLGVRYLWIDSLCIVQDFKEDWLLQSSLMAKIYSRSLLDIAATSSRDEERGLSHLWDPAAINSCHAKFGDVRLAAKGY